MEFVNLLHHPVNVIREDGSITIIKPSGKSVGRLIPFGPSKIVGLVNGIPVIERDSGAIQNLSPADDKTYYIVSTITAREACHPQVISPNTIDKTQVVYEGGRIIGIRSFQTFRRSDNGNSSAERNSAILLRQEGGS